ncbi:protein required for normal CLN1 and CLN2 G1 cyclin expression [Malassezia japonica]|uniref:Protein required for normal CLN1 and CLN2 G1 cyclin expression n=1 Tax=Malassezia japonica TaxID=223818 RepID=A0AAF0J976_9BASI|nr:protein required for normal CLN1 and CLN2 G1 cyclin expression [Malassezia japonica]WFD38427.1 protein required for normal CLN1 and CLN2 G1 cyclin expression [Malassezia japonica]
MDGASEAIPASEGRSAKSLELVLATNESITIDLDPLPSPEELEVVIDILVEEKPAAYFWTALASRCWNAGRRAEAELIVTKGCSILPVHRPDDSIPLFSLHAAFQLDDARKAPKQVLPDARYQILQDKQPKQHYFRNTIEALNQAQSLNPQHPMIVQSRAVFALLTGDNALAGKLFDVMLSREPMHAIALLGKACVLLRAKQYMNALQTYQLVLRLALKMDQLAAAANDSSLRWTGPDARVGIGLCLWALGRHDPARRAWRRAVDANPDNHAPRLLLGLSLVNAAKQVQALPHGWYGAQTQHSEDVARRTAYAEGIVLLQSAWRLDKTNAMTAVALSAHLLSQSTHQFAQALPAAHDFTTAPQPVPEELEGQISATLDRALKLGEHAIQYADSKSPVIQGWLQYAHALHLASQLARNNGDRALRLLSQRYYARASEELARLPPVPGLADPDGTHHQLSHGLALATLGMAQLQASSGDQLAATNTLDAVLARPSPGSNQSYGIELGLLAALLLATPQLGATPEQVQADRRKARVLLDRTLRLAEASGRAAHGARDEDEHDRATRPDDAEATTDGALLQAETAIEAEHLAPRTLEAVAQFDADPLVHAQLAALCAPNDVDRAVRNYAQALRVAQSQDGEKALQAQLQLNMGALLVQHGAALTQAPSARQNTAWALRQGITYLERAFTVAGEAAASSSDVATAVKVLANYDLGRAFEASGDKEQAREAYKALLAAHPEYVDARVRLAILAANEPHGTELSEQGVSRAARDVANTRFKEALSCDPGNLDTRAAYIRFLAGEYPANRQPAWAAIKELAAQLFLGPDAGKKIFGSPSAARRAAEEARHDAFVLSALGWAYYQLGLHTAPGPSYKADRSKSMLRAADLFDKALAAHPQCVFAAQGLAILLADDALSDPSAPPETAEERRKLAAEDAIILFGKLRELRDDASVYICQGHAFMIRSELERALHVYDLALTRYDNERNPMVLQYVARAAYALGLREKEFAHLQLAQKHLTTAAEALASRSADANSAAGVERKQVLYNKAVMAQKALQMLCDLPIAQQRSAELQEAIEWVTSSQPTLPELEEAARNNQLLYITAEVVEQRAKYAETSLLRQAQKQLEEARAYEAQQAEQLRLLDEKQKAKDAQLEQMRREREEEHRRRAEAIAESRRRAREEAAQIEYVKEPSPEPKKRSGGGGGGGRRKKQPEAQEPQDQFVANDSSDGADDLFAEDSESDASDGDQDEDEEQQPAAAPAEPSESQPDAEASTEAPAPKSTREKLAELARQRKQRNKDERQDKKSKKRRSHDKPKDREAKKPKVAADNDTIDSDEEMNL